MTAATHPSPRRPVGSLRRQIILFTAAITALGVIVLTLLVQLLLQNTARNELNADLAGRSARVIQAANESSSSGRLVVPDTELLGGVAVYDASGRLVAGSAPAALLPAYDELRRTRSITTVDVNESSRVRATPFRTRSGLSGVAIVEGSFAPYEVAERYALVVSIMAGLIMLVAMTALAAWATKRALAPVATMAFTAEEWSEHDLGRRFALGPPTNEITALGQTLDTLLAKVAHAIRSEQRLTSELAHELRTPLTAIQGTAELAMMRTDLDAEMREDLEDIDAASRRMTETISGLMELARSESSRAAAEKCELGVVVDEVITDLEARIDGTGVSVRSEVPPGVYVEGSASLVARAVSPVVDNAIGLATHVVLSAATDQPGEFGLVSLFVDDDGPGVARAERDRIFEPGLTTGQGSGLGLALSRRIARSLGGEVEVGDRATGTRFVVRLPRA